MTVRELLEESRDMMQYFRERMEEYRFAEMAASNPRKRDLDSAAIDLADRKKELDKLAEEATARGKRVYVLISLLNNRKQQEALWALYAYGLSEEQAMKRAKCRCPEELQLVVFGGVQELERLVRAQ